MDQSSLSSVLVNRNLSGHSHTFLFMYCLCCFAFIYLLLCISVLPMEDLGFPSGSDGKESTCNAGDLGPSMGLEDPLEEGMATHSSILAWRIPWTEEPGGVHGVSKNQA